MKNLSSNFLIWELRLTSIGFSASNNTQLFYLQVTNKINFEDIPIEKQGAQEVPSMQRTIMAKRCFTFYLIRNDEIN